VKCDIFFVILHVHATLKVLIPHLGLESQTGPLSASLDNAYPLAVVAVGRIYLRGKVPFVSIGSSPTPCLHVQNNLDSSRPAAPLPSSRLYQIPSQHCGQRCRPRASNMRICDRLHS
jgi:hypothetical protein